MAALAMFMFNYLSMLNFDGAVRRNERNAFLIRNLKGIYGLGACAVEKLATIYCGVDRNVILDIDI